MSVDFVRRCSEERFGAYAVLRMLDRNAACESRKVGEKRNTCVRERLQRQRQNGVFDRRVDLDVGGTVRWL